MVEIKTTYNVINTGTNCGFHYRVVIKSFTTKGAADRFAARMKTKEPFGFFFVEVSK